MPTCSMTSSPACTRLRRGPHCAPCRFLEASHGSLAGWSLGDGSFMYCRSSLGGICFLRVSMFVCNNSPSPDLLALWCVFLPAIRLLSQDKFRAFVSFSRPQDCQPPTWVSAEGGRKPSFLYLYECLHGLVPGSHLIWAHHVCAHTLFKTFSRLGSKQPPIPFGRMRSSVATDPVGLVPETSCDVETPLFSL